MNVKLKTRRRCFGIPRYFVSVICVLSLASIAFGESKFTDLAANATGAAISMSGKVAVTDINSDLWMFDDLTVGTPQPKTVQRLEAKPVSVLWKKFADHGYFVVLCEDHTLLVYDDARLELVTKLKVAAARSSVAASRTSTDPYVYVAVSTTAEGRFAVTRFNISTLKIEDVLVPGNDRRFEVSSMAISPLGDLLFERESGSGATELFVWRIPNAGEKALKEVVDHGRSERDSILIDQTGNVFIAGDALHSLSVKNIKSLGALAYTFFDDHPLLATLTAKDIRFISTNSFEQVTFAPYEFPAPADARGLPRGGRGPLGMNQGPRFLLADSGHSAVIVIWGKQAIAVPLAPLDLPREPFLGVRMKHPESLKVGQTVKIQLEKLDPSSSVSLANAPAGVTLEKDNIVWTPESKDVGFHSFRIKTVDGNSTREQDLVLKVENLFIELPFDIADMAISPDGKLVAVLTTISPPRPKENPGAFDALHIPRPTLALINVANQKVVVQKELDISASAIAMSNDHVFVTSSDSPLILAYDVNQLAESKRMFLDKPASSALIVNEDHLFTTDGIYSIPSLEKRFSADSFPRVDYNSLQMQVAPLAQADGILFHGILYDSALKPKLIATASWLPSMETSNYSVPRADAVQSRDAPAYVSPWNVAGNEFRVTHPGPVNGVMESGIYTVLPDTPAFIVLRNHQVNLSLGPSNDTPVHGTARAIGPQILEIAVRDLIRGNDVKTIELGEMPKRNSPSFWPELRLRSNGKSLFVAADNRLFVVPSSAIVSDKLSIPITMEPKQSLFVLDPSGPNKLTYKAHGGKGAIRYSVKGETEGIVMDGDSGVLTLDPAKLAPKAIDRLIANKNAFLSSATASTRLPDLANSLKKAVKQILGQEVAGFPVGIWLAITATDSEQQSTTLPHYVILPLLIDEIQKRLKDTPPVTASNPSSQAIVPSMSAAQANERTQQLQQQIHDLEVENKTLKELLLNRQTPATKP